MKNFAHSILMVLNCFAIVWTVFTLVTIGYVFWRDPPLNEQPLMGDIELRNTAERLFRISKKDCYRYQYLETPELEYKGQYIFHPKAEHENRCPILKIGLNPYFGDVASFEEIYAKAQ